MRKILTLLILTLSFQLLSIGAAKLETAVLGASAPEARETLMAQSTSPSGNLDSAGFTFELNPVVNEGIEGSVKQHWIREGINYFFSRVIGLMAGVVGGLAVLMISYGGFLMLASGGNEELQSKGKDYIKYSVIGLIAVLSAYILVNAVQLLVKSIYG